MKGKDFDIIKIGENLNFSYSTKNGVGQGNQYWNDVYLALSACPLLPMYDAEGNLYDQADKTADGWNLQGSIGNPVIDLVANRGQNLNRNYNLNATAYLEIQPIKGLKYRGQFSYRMSSSSYRSLRLHTMPVPQLPTVLILLRKMQVWDITSHWKMLFLMCCQNWVDTLLMP